jgi:hypothetical protein
MKESMLDRPFFYFVKYFLNESSDRLASASVSRTDFAFVAGFEM